MATFDRPVASRWPLYLKEIVRTVQILSLEPEQTFMVFKVDSAKLCQVRSNKLFVCFCRLTDYRFPAAAVRMAVVIPSVVLSSILSACEHISFTQ